MRVFEFESTIVGQTRVERHTRVFLTEEAFEDVKNHLQENGRWENNQHVHARSAYKTRAKRMEITKEFPFRD
mgnify:CR=1 FL=1